MSVQPHLTDDWAYEKSANETEAEKAAREAREAEEEALAREKEEIAMKQEEEVRAKRATRNRALDERNARRAELAAGGKKQAATEVRLDDLEMALLESQGGPGEAAAASKAGSTPDPELAEAFFERGWQFEKQRKLTEAAKAYRAAIAADQNNTNAKNNLGVLLHNQERLVDAEKAYRAAIAADQKYALAHLNLGVLLKGQGKIVEAEKAYRAAIAADPNFTLARARGNAREIALPPSDLRTVALYVASGTFTRDRAEVLKATLDELRTEAAWGNAHRTFYRDAVAKATRLPLPVLDGMLARYKDFLFAVDPITPADIATQQRVADYLLAAKVIPRKIDAAEAAWTGWTPAK